MFLKNVFQKMFFKNVLQKMFFKNVFQKMFLKNVFPKMFFENVFQKMFFKNVRRKMFSGKSFVKTSREFRDFRLPATGRVAGPASSLLSSILWDVRVQQSTLSCARYERSSKF